MPSSLVRGFIDSTSYRSRLASFSETLIEAIVAGDLERLPRTYRFPLDAMRTQLARFAAYDRPSLRSELELEAGREYAVRSSGFEDSSVAANGGGFL